MEKSPKRAHELRQLVAAGMSARGFATLADDLFIVAGQDAWRAGGGPEKGADARRTTVRDEVVRQLNASFRLHGPARENLTPDELRDAIFHEGRRQQLNVSKVTIEPQAAGPEKANWTATVVIEGMDGRSDPLAPVIARLQRQYHMIV